MKSEDEVREFLDATLHLDARVELPGTIRGGAFASKRGMVGALLWVLGEDPKEWIVSAAPGPAVKQRIA
jgi:hypothetical protein